MVLKILSLLALTLNVHGFVNLAYRRPVYELHPWPTTDKDYGSQNAVDGLYSNRSAAGGQCSISADNNYTEALLRVDLEDVVSISYVTIYFRTENQPRPTVFTSQMAGFSLYVSNTTSKDNGYLCFHEIQTEAGTPSENQNISCSVHGRYVIFYNERRPEVAYPPYYSKYTHNGLCELEVYGCREPGYFGDKCSLTCPPNCQEKRCNISTGHCLGCLPGYKGTGCKDVCKEMTFGLECASTCSRCRNGTSCHHENGTCLQGCNEGVSGDMCQSDCLDGFFGETCSHQCSKNCYLTSRCDRITGKCAEGCKPGWRTDTCDQKCLVGYFGSECLNKCGHCLNVTHCNHINGSCSNGCSRGYKGDNCNEWCPKGYFGLDCLQKCSTYCSGNESCNRFTGVCDEGCKDGWSGPICGTNEPDDNDSYLIIKVFFGLSFGIMVIIFAVWFYVWCRNK